jgi:hypothetical protein
MLNDDWRNRKHKRDYEQDMVLENLPVRVMALLMQQGKQD